MRTAGRTLKVILLDIVGILLIILAGLTGWLPGPGGIPLLIAGLAVLSINHKWAKRWLVAVKENGLKISDKFFSASPRMSLLIDVIGIVFLALAVYIVFFITQNNIAKTAGVWLVIVSLVLLLGNRGRIKKIKKK